MRRNGRWGGDRAIADSEKQGDEIVLRSMPRGLGWNECKLVDNIDGRFIVIKFRNDTGSKYRVETRIVANVAEDFSNQVVYNESFILSPHHDSRELTADVSARFGRSPNNLSCLVRSYRPISSSDAAGPRNQPFVLSGVLTSTHTAGSDGVLLYVESENGSYTAAAIYGFTKVNGVVLRQGQTLARFAGHAVKVKCQSADERGDLMALVVTF